MSGRASTDSMRSSEFGVCDRRQDIVSRLEPEREERRDGSLRGKSAGSGAGSPGPGPSSCFYLIGLWSGIDVVAARLKIKGVDGEPPFGFFHLLGEVEKRNTVTDRRRKRRKDERRQSEKIPTGI